MCHNDLHNGNVMINKEGDLDLIFVDYDNAGYGYVVHIVCNILCTVILFETEL